MFANPASKFTFTSRSLVNGICFVTWVDPIKRKPAAARRKAPSNTLTKVKMDFFLVICSLYRILRYRRGFVSVVRNFVAQVFVEHLTGSENVGFHRSNREFEDFRDFGIIALF